MVEVADISDASLRYDLDTKAQIYAAHGVPEYWVINAATLSTTVHRQPSGEVWGFVDEVAPSDMLTASRAPALSVSLGALPLQSD